MNTLLKKYLKKIKSVEKQIKEIWLFGSRARGDYQFNSDYDLLIVVEKRSRKLLDVIYTAASDMLLDDLIDISAKVFPYTMVQELRKRKTPFMTNVQKEGIRLV